jgi:hypothetical protein
MRLGGLDRLPESRSELTITSIITFVRGAVRRLWPNFAPEGFTTTIGEPRDYCICSWISLVATTGGRSWLQSPDTWNIVGQRCAPSSMRVLL